MPTRLVQPTARRLQQDTIDAWQTVPSAIAADKLNGRCHADPRIRPIRPRPVRA
jgi:hypothetical protein